MEIPSQQNLYFPPKRVLASNWLTDAYFDPTLFGNLLEKSLIKI